MQRKRDIRRFEEKLGCGLRGSLSLATPDVFDNIREKSEAYLKETAREPKRGRVYRLLRSRGFRRAAVGVLGAAVIVSSLSVFLYRLPYLQAKADMVYDSGGRLGPVAGAASPDGAYIASYNSFGYGVFKSLYSGGKNTFISPASIYLALGMAYNGAEGQTASEMAKALGASGESLGSFDGSSQSLQALISSDGGYRLANSIWLGNSFSGMFSGDFLNIDKKYFGASVATLDFGSPAAPTVLGRWVSSNTGGLLNPSFKNIDADTAMYLINTIYFKADWATKFDGNNTGTHAFNSPAGAKNVKFMNGTFSGYFENDKLQGIELPYAGNKTSMLILLPKTNLDDMLSGLTADEIAGFTRDNVGNVTQARLSLPRVNFKCEYTLNDTLKGLGMVSAFDPLSSDFSGMLTTEAKAQGNNLFISEIDHMTSLSIDEKGTEAAAATVVTMKSTSSEAPPPHIMDVDHPFLTAIVDNRTGAILFIGAVTDPSAG